MKKTFILMFAVLFTFSFIFIGCSEPDDTSNTTDTTTTDPALDGTWVNEDGYIVILYKANFEFRDDDNEPYEKGTFKTDGNKIILTTTHYYDEGNWLSKDDYKTAMEEEYGPLSEDNLADIDEAFSPQTFTYKLEGNTLTITKTYEDKEGETITNAIVFTKQ
jgi:hypothetical protein